MINFTIFKTFRKLWSHLCPATKSIFIIGVICFLATVPSVFFENSHSNSSYVVMRSVMSSIFGFLFGDQEVPNSNIKNRKFQVFVASAIAISSLFIIILTQWININSNNSSLVEIRNLMFASVGFLVSRAKAIEAAEINAHLECECEANKIKSKNT